MNRERAKEILLLHRPGVTDDADPALTEALALVREDAELRRWFEAQQAAHAAIRAQLKTITPPPGFKAQILSERPWHTRPVKAWHALATVAVLVVLCALGLWWSGREPREDKSFASYRNRMVSTALRAYGMQLETDKLASIRAFLQAQGAPADFVAPTGLTNATGTGCLTDSWQGRKVTMICFKTGRPLPPGHSSDLWFFVVDQAAVPGAPETDQPRFTSIKHVTTASWTRAGKTYLLAVEGDETLLRKFL